MKTFSEFLPESKTLSVAKKANAALPDNLDAMLKRWEAGNYPTDKLEAAFRNGSDVAKAMEAAFIPVREQMQKEYGKTVRLYRGIQKQSENHVIKFDPKRTIYSWTSDEKVAIGFAGNNPKTKNIKLITDAEIRIALKKFETRGFVSFRGYKYIVNKASPKYYNIYQRNEFVTDGDNLERELKRQQQDIADAVKSMNNHGFVIKKDVDINDVVWLTNNLGSKEFLVKNKRKYI